MFIAEAVAVMAVAVQFVLPSQTGISVIIGHRSLALPIRWVVPLVLITMAGALSLAALLAMYWRLAQVPIAAGR
jgi:hypothetical protein